MRKIKSFLKKSLLWKLISQSALHLKMTRPEYYRKQKEELIFYQNLLGLHPAKNDLIFDVGANKGNKSLLFSKLAKEVIAFEPSHKLNALLSRKLKATNVKIYNVALGNKASMADMYIVNKSQAYNSLKIKHIENIVKNRRIAGNEDIYRQKVKIETLDSFIAKKGLPKYIKIDVEGYEVEVLKGLNTPVPILSFEANLPEFKEEAIDCIEHTANISKAYSYNFAQESLLLKEEFLPPEAAIKFLQETDLRYVEIYALLS